MRLIQLIMEHLLGKKYYANIIYRRGTDEIDMSSFIFRNRRDAENHRRDLEGNASFGYVDTVSFRTKKEL